MGEHTKIEWCHHTLNWWIGCTKLSPACDNCYAESLAERYGWVTWGPGEDRRQTTEGTRNKARKWDRDAARDGVRRRVFCNSLSDVFDAEVPDAWRFDLMNMIELTPNLDYLVLTKRPQVAWKFFQRRLVPSNVWMGTTVENNDMAGLRIPPLLGIRARRHFLSCEPLLEDLELDSLFLAELDWIICGGESGRHVRNMDVAWARSLRDQCQTAGVYFFMKQMSGRAEIPADLMVREIPPSLDAAIATLERLAEEGA